MSKSISKSKAAPIVKVVDGWLQQYCDRTGKDTALCEIVDSPEGRLVRDVVTHVFLLWAPK